MKTANDLMVAMRKGGLSKAEWRTLDDEAQISDGFNSWTFRKGSQYKVWETANFGWIAFAPGTKLVSGVEPPKRLFKF